VLAHYARELRPAAVVHFNFMARGEVLANANVLARADELIDRLGELAEAQGVIPVYKFSTIMPRNLGERELTHVFRRSQPDIYYSLYSVETDFRRRWLPRALPVAVALQRLVRWQEITHKLPVLHWAYIAGENDSIESTERLVEVVQRSGLRADINIVRYNPYSPRQGSEPAFSVLLRNQQLLQVAFPSSRVQIVTRVGFDVAASCGMFVGAST
jgi:23S rRNA (adenine2503-C2)-methyltransferase